MSVPGIDLERLLPWFRANVAPVGELSAELIGHGRSNLTYRLRAGDDSWVLRRPPLSHVQATAHDMSREFRILSALAPTDFPAPKPYALCSNESRRRKIGEELVEVLVRLHTSVPEEIGLSDFGKPQGYLERQVRRFSDQLAQIRYRETPELDELARRLKGAIPAERKPGIVHGDYRLDHAILDHEGHIIAVLDWEMCTLGDSLADMGLLRMYWQRNGEGTQLALAGLPVVALPGFPTWEEAAARYQEKSGNDLSNLDFYAVLAHFKLGVILENMYKRFLGGGTVGAGFEMIGQQAVILCGRP